MHNKYMGQRETSYFKNIIILIIFILIAVFGYQWFFTDDDTQEVQPSINVVQEVVDEAEPKIGQTDVIPEVEEIKEEVSTEIVQTEDPVEELPKVAEDTSEWYELNNERHGFFVLYPKNWVWNEYKRGQFGFGHYEIKEDFQWGITIHENGSKTIDEAIAMYGTQFTDRAEKRTQVTFGDITATKAVITTPTYPEWQLVAIVFADDKDRVFVIENGAVNDIAFDAFYQSFYFTR